MFTDGADNSSRLNARTASVRARQSGVPVFSLAQGAALDNRGLVRVLAQIAASTGGEQYFARKASDVERIFRDISADLNPTCWFAFKSPGSANKGWRRIQLSVRLPGKVTIRAKNGYYPQ